MKVTELKEALDIIAKYNDYDYVNWGGRHDVIYFDDVKEKMTKEDKDRMIQIGFIHDMEFNCWKVYT